MYSPSELATIQFYQWEYLYRGYYLFDEPVDIEVPYRSINSFVSPKNNIVDDGKAPSLLSQALQLFVVPKKPEEPEPVSFKAIKPHYISEPSSLVGFRLFFERNQEINQLRNIEFLNMLTFTEHSISFEIVGNSDSIDIQIVCDYTDCDRVRSQLIAYFPDVILKRFKPKEFKFDFGKDIAIADFGLSEEFVRPLNTSSSYELDSLTSILAVFDILKGDEVAIFQIIFKGISSPLAKDIPIAVSDGKGGSFFADAPEMTFCAKEKTSTPLFSVVLRVATQGESNSRSSDLARDFIKSITSISASEFNKLIPLSNKGYDYDFHLYNLLHRQSNRLGFVLNSKELSTFVHYPNKTIVSHKLRINHGKSKLLPCEAKQQKYSIGLNTHNNEKHEVSLSDISRLSHTHIIGSTGVGKSTLLVNLVLEDIAFGNGCAIFDPHGDVVEDILLRIPEKRKHDVIVIDPSDIDYPIGFNILSASSEIEKIVLSSDLVSSFKKFSTTWGDNINAVFSQAIAVFLEGNRKGTLLDLKRFLIEDGFRNEYLKDIDEPSILYYWEHEYQMVRKGIAPLLTRIDTFLRPRIIRNMFCQNEGIDFNDCVNSKKIVLIKLSQGLIGEQNCFLLGSIFLSKFNQVIQGRQSIPKSERDPYYIYLDEFQNMITPSILSILSGARKYGLGLVLVHQELSQISDPQILNSVIANPYIRICFRLGDNDAKRLESGFSYFDASDLTTLSIGQAIVKLGGSDNDFNIKTMKLPEYDQKRAEVVKKEIIKNSRDQFAKAKGEVEEIIRERFRLFSNKETKQNPKKVRPRTQSSDVKEITSKVITEEAKKQIKESELISLELKAHRYLQNLIIKMGQDRNYIGVIEHPTSDGGRIDVVLSNDDIKIAFEVSETNSPSYEIQNIKKCLKEKYNLVVVVSKRKNHLDDIEKLASQRINKAQLSCIRFILPEQLAELLDDYIKPQKPREEMIKGIRVVTEYNSDELISPHSIKTHISKLFRKKK
ncbi:type IV secretion system DNA-binding domain-containing protein [uncultured Psychroserpens sp.]|uniref:type IV secretory system conjugative DNA transfer family protein n=1 Tax=uncultured Psychroserpens sp. TaxID=255436 RepID=UPI0026313B7E|nr:type IV secretion system DNA-binding domain-containing protein [uncultured Psychroserpens sp.]